MNRDAKIEYEDARYLADKRLDAIQNALAILNDESLGEPLRIARVVEYLEYKIGIKP